MTYTEIIKNLEYTIYPYVNETDITVKALKDFISSQKAEIERLNHKYGMAVAEREANMKGFLEELNRWNKETQKARTEAIKEFAERLKETGEQYGAYDCVFALFIDNLVKEMTVETE